MEPLNILYLFTCFVFRHLVDAPELAIIITIMPRDGLIEAVVTAAKKIGK